MLADWHLNKRLGPAAAAFSRGLSRVIPPSWLRLFSPREVNQLLGGGEDSALDVEDMQAHTQYRYVGDAGLRAMRAAGRQGLSRFAAGMRVHSSCSPLMALPCLLLVATAAATALPAPRSNTSGRWCAA